MIDETVLIPHMVTQLIFISTINQNKFRVGMIVIEHVKAHLPQRNCQIKFLLKAKSEQIEHELKSSEVKLTEDFIDIELRHTIDISSFKTMQTVAKKNKKFKKKSKSTMTINKIFELCVIAVNQTDKIYVGHIQIQLNSRLQHHFQQLKGLTDQNGFIVFSVFPDGVQEEIKRSNKETSELSYPENGEQRYKEADEFPQNIDSHFQNIELSNKQNQMEQNQQEASLNQSESPLKNPPVEYREEYQKQKVRDFTLGRQNQSEDVEQPRQKEDVEEARQDFEQKKKIQNLGLEPQMKNQTTSKSQNLSYQLEMLLIQEKLKNQKYWNRLQQNEIFQLKIKKRVEALLEAK